MRRLRIGNAILVILILAIVVAAGLVSAYFSAERDLSSFGSEAFDGAIRLYWDPERLHSDDHIELSVLYHDGESIFVLPPDAADYVFTDGVDGEKYSFSVQALLSNGKRGEVHTADRLFLRDCDPNSLPSLLFHSTDGNDPVFTPLYPPEEGMVGCSITDNDYVEGRCAISNISSAPEFCAGAKLRVRGNTSAAFCSPGDKLPYKLVLDEPADLFGTGRTDRHFILLASAGEDLKTYLGFLVGEKCGLAWTPACRFVNLFVNDDYKGIYLLTEALENSALAENVGSDGILFEGDAYWWKTDAFFHSQRLSHGLGYTVKFPEISGESNGTLRSLEAYINRLEEQLFSGAGLDEIDEDSFAAWIMARDLLGSGDPLGSNAYYYLRHFDGVNTRDQLSMGPLWDFDAAFSKPASWSEQHGTPTLYFTQLFENMDFCRCYLSKWLAVSPTLSTDLAKDLAALIDAEGEAIDRAREQNAQRWGSDYVSLEEEAAQRLDWLDQQIVWIDGQLARAEELNYKNFVPVPLSLSADGRKLTVSFRGSQYKRVIFAVFSEARGQSDLEWYRPTLARDGYWTRVITLSPYRADGVYYVHVYADLGNGRELLTGTWFYLDPLQR